MICTPSYTSITPRVRPTSYTSALFLLVLYMLCAPSGCAAAAVGFRLACLQPVLYCHQGWWGLQLGIAPGLVGAACRVQAYHLVV